MSTNDGGPAFPSVELNRETGFVCDQHFGMTLRDYFAAKAMQGMCAHHDTWGLSVEQLADKAFVLSDAMLKARNK